MSDAVAGAKYVVGFMFDATESSVLLPWKNRPAWQRDRINGIGGRIESGESALEAMRREFREEAGMDHPDWREFCVLSDWREWSIHFFSAVGHLGDAQQCTDELPMILPVNELPNNVIPNLRWLIPMALTMKHESADCFEVLELKNGTT